MSLHETIAKNEDGSLPSFTWPGGYPLFYLMADSGVLCPDCANNEEEASTDSKDDAQWHIIAVEVNWETEGMICDHCNAQIESAYGDS